MPRFIPGEPIERSFVCELGGQSATGSGAGGTVYTPAAQPAADSAFQNIGQSLINQSQAGLNGDFGGPTGNPAAIAWPQVYQATQDVINNPYAGQAVQGAQTGANLFDNFVLPSEQYGAAAMQGIGAQAAGQTGAAIGSTYGNPAYGRAAALGAGQAPGMSAAGSSILTAGFDPQNALFTRTRSQLTDQANASNAAAGLSGSPYGASTVDNALGTFDINWQNNQLNREATAIPAAAQANSSSLSSLLTPANNLSSATLQGTGAFENLAGTANRGFTGASTMLGNAAQGASSFNAAPYTTANTIAGNKIGALGNENTLGLQQYAVPQQTINDIESYLGIGQSASSIANTIGSTNFNETAQGLGGLGSLAGQAFGGGGSGGGGFLGSFGTPNTLSGDAGGGGFLPDLAQTGSGGSSGSGILGSLASLAPAAFSA